MQVHLCIGIQKGDENETERKEVGQATRLHKRTVMLDAGGCVESSYTCGAVKFMNKKKKLEEEEREGCLIRPVGRIE
jgi:hypothetical protein